MRSRSAREGCGGSLADVTDKGAAGELRHPGELKSGWARTCSDDRGAGAHPMHQMGHVRLEKELCHDGPLYTLGPLVTTSPRYEPLRRRSGAMIGWLAPTMLC